jgi:hypothetical protein
MRKISATLVLLACIFAIAQQSNDVDKQKLIDIEQTSAVPTSFNSPGMGDFLQKYLYDGTTSVVTQFGHLYRSPKSDVVAFTKKPDLNDPNVKVINKLSDFQVDIYDDTALVSYKQVTSESGHKEQALNVASTLTCLDTFVKRKAEWYAIGSSCASATPIAQSRWDAMQKMEELEKQQQKVVPPSSPQ